MAQALGGLMSVTGEPGRGPMRVGIPISDIVTGLYSALGILTALIERQRSGEGQWVQASLLESQTFMLDLQAARFVEPESTVRAERAGRARRRVAWATI